MTAPHDSPRERNESPIEAKLAAPPPFDPAARPVGEDTVTRGAATQIPTTEVSSSGNEWIQSKMTVLAILFLVTGFLGIPLLWVNKRFNTTERILWTILVIVYTSALIWIAAVIVIWSYRQVFA